jgi:hypothetical protein
MGGWVQSGRGQSGKVVGRQRGNKIAYCNLKHKRSVGFVYPPKPPGRKTDRAMVT